MKALASVAAVALALIVAQAAPATTGGAARESKASVTVGINGFAFHPHTIKVSKGTTVVFSNSSSVTHTATRAGAFDTGRIKPGRSVAVRFTQKGTFAYHCTIHPFMHGKIVVG
jgi:plastocyanin